MRKALAGTCCWSIAMSPQDTIAGTTKATAMATYGSQLIDGMPSVLACRSDCRRCRRASQVTATTTQNHDRKRSGSAATDGDGASDMTAMLRSVANTQAKATTRRRDPVRLKPRMGTRDMPIARRTRDRSPAGEAAAMTVSPRLAPESRPSGYRSRCQSTIAPAQATIARSSPKITCPSRLGLTHESAGSPHHITGYRPSPATNRTASMGPRGADPIARRRERRHPVQAADGDDEPALPPAEVPKIRRRRTCRARAARTIAPGSSRPPPLPRPAGTPSPSSCHTVYPDANTVSATTSQVAGSRASGGGRTRAGDAESAAGPVSCKGPRPLPGASPPVRRLSLTSATRAFAAPHACLLRPERVGYEATRRVVRCCPFYSHQREGRDWASRGPGVFGERPERDAFVLDRP